MFDASKSLPQFSVGRDLEVAPDEVGFFDTLGAQLGQYDPLISNFMDIGSVNLEPDPEFNPAQAVFDMPKEYHQYSNMLLFAENQEHLNYLQGKVDDALARKEVIANSTLGNTLLASFFDPINFIALPIGATSTALRAGASTAALVAGQEAMLAAADPTRTFEEAAFAVGTSGIAGGALGAISGFVRGKDSGTIISNTVKDIDEEVKMFVDDSVEETAQAMGDPTIAKNWFTDSWAFKFATSPMKRHMQNEKATVASKQFHYQIAGDFGILAKAHQDGDTLGSTVFTEQAQFKAEINQLYQGLMGAFSRTDSKGVLKVLDYAVGRQRDFDEFMRVASIKRIKGEEGANLMEKEAINLLDDFYKTWETRLIDTGLIGTEGFYKKSAKFWTERVANVEKRFGELKQSKTPIKRNGKLTKFGRYYKDVENRLIEYKAKMNDINATLEQLAQRTEAMPPNETKFFPRYFNKAAITANREQFEKILREWFQNNPEGIVYTPESPVTRIEFDTTPEAIARRAKETADRILGLADETAFENAYFGYGKSKHFMHRQLDIPNELLLDFIEANPFKVSMAYNMKIAPRYSFAKKFDGQDFDTMMDYHVDDMMKQGMDYDDVLAIAKDTRSSYDRVMNAALREPHTWDQQVTQRVKDLATLNYMGSSGLASITEVGRIMAEHGVGKTFRALIGNMTDKKVQLARQEAQKAGEALEGAIFSTATRFSDELMTNPMYHNLWEKGKDAFYVLNLLTPITRGLKNLDAIVRQDQIINMAVRERDGIADAWEVEYLRRYNIDKKTARDIANAPWERSESGLIYANTDAWQSTAHLAAKEKFQRAMSSGILNTIMNATPADRPIMADGVAMIPMRIAKQFGMKEDAKYKGYARIENGMLSFPFQFYSFTLAAVNKTTSAYTTGQMKSPLFGTLFMMGFAYTALELKSQLTVGGERAWDNTAFSDKMLRSFDYSGAAALYSDMFYTSIATSMAMTGENYMEGYVSAKFPEEQNYMSAVTGLTGAGPSIIQDYASAGHEMITGDLGEGAKDLIRKLPYTKLWFLSQLTNDFTNALSKGIDDGGIDGFRRY